MRLSFNISYDGTNYSGWQRQPNGITVQEEIEKALTTILRNPIPITGCGRTDAGVHASDYYFHCDVDRESVTTDKIVYQLNSLLPDDITINEVSEVDDDWNARYSAVTRSYEYFFHTKHDPFIRKYSYYYPGLNDVSLSAINIFCDFILNQQEFKVFCKTNSGVNHYLCDIYQVTFQEIDEHKFKFKIKANRYLRGMIRLMVGAMLNFGRGKITKNDLEHSFDNQVSLPINWSVPGHALFLSEVTYPILKQ